MSDDNRTSPSRPDLTRWLLGAFVLLAGWLFILWQNKFYVTAPVVFVCLGYLAVLATVVTLWRTGAAAADESLDEDDDATWGGTLGARGELEREKRTLLKAIKEAEFDREMGKLSKADADSMISLYRARAIEVIKELDRLDGASAGTVREQIERELKARLEIEGKARKAAAKAGAQAGASKPKPATDAPRKDEAKSSATLDASADEPAASPSPANDDRAASADDESAAARKAAP